MSDPMGRKRAATPAFTLAHVPLLDQGQDQADSSISPWAGCACIQTFTARTSGLLRFVELDLAPMPEDSVGGGKVIIRAVANRAPNSRAATVLTRGEAMALNKGWNRFDLTAAGVSVTAGCCYAIQFVPQSACDWLIATAIARTPGRDLYQQWGDEPWEAVSGSAAAFRVYVEPFRSASSPSVRQA